MPKVMYICDPDKNIDCLKTHCHRNGGPCTMTTRVEFAKQPVEKAILVFDVNEEDMAAISGFKGDNDV